MKQEVKSMIQSFSQNFIYGKKNEYTNKIPLQIHHVDGNCINNTEDNLMLLCPNCHSLTNTFGNLNKNSKRNNRNKK